jgi:hypothetical protein
MLIIVVYLYAAAVAQYFLDVSAAFINIHFLLMVPHTPILDRADLADENIDKVLLPLETIFMSTVRQDSFPDVCPIFKTM